MIDIKTDKTVYKKKSVLSSVVKLTLNRENLSEELCDLTILVTDDASIQNLNKEFLDIDKPTDVLSFPSGEVDPENGNRYLGDIAISYERALAQSTAAGHSVENELSLLVIHGVLHLLGYDHATEQEKKKMWEKQSSILEELGITMNVYSGEA